MALFSSKAKTRQTSFAARRAAHSVGLRAKALGHMARGQGYLAAARSNAMLARSSGYMRRHPWASMGIVAGLMSLIGYGIARSRR